MIYNKAEESIVMCLSSAWEKVLAEKREIANKKLHTRYIILCYFKRNAPFAIFSALLYARKAARELFGSSNKVMRYFKFVHFGDTQLFEQRVS